MDLSKKVALLKWLDALSVRSVTNFEDLRDASVITDILCTCGDLLPDSSVLSSAEKRLASVKAYIEGCYHQSFDDGSLINFQMLSSNTRGDVFELEMGKLLLALLGCVVQDKSRERFIAPALDMDAQSQYELKEMIETLLFVSDSDTHLPDDFAEVLKRKTESSSHRDAALFFKLVADGRTDSPQRTQGTPNPSASSSVNDSVYAMYSNSPQAGNTSGINIRDISSPLRVMSISSPITPLGALMYSPQLAQKIVYREEDKRKQLEALLRKKTQEYKRLDLEHQNEKHLRQELEYDLEQCGQKILDKDNKIRELERQLEKVRKLRDNQDELEALRMERERLESNVRDLQSRLNEQQTLKETNQMLENEISNMLKDQKSTRDELDLMNSVKKTCEVYRVQSHKQQLTLKELEASLEHRNREVDQLREQLEEENNMRQVCMEKYNTVKKEKEELEELYGSNQGGISAGLPVYSGESMNIVTEKRLSELQAEYDQLRSSWIDPVQHHSICEQLKQEEEAKATFEEQFMRTKTQLMNLESDNEKLRLNLSQFESRVGSLECDLAKSQEKCGNLESQANTLQNSEESLQGNVRNLRQELSQLQTELMLTNQELDNQKKVSEDRRLTIAQLDEVKAHTMNSEQQLRQSEQAMKSTIRELEISIDKLKGENMLIKDEVTVLKEKVTHLNEDNSELSIKLEQERSINASTVKKLNVDLNEEKMSTEQTQSSLKKVTNEFAEYRAQMEARIEELTETVSEISKEKNTVDLEVRKLQLELESTMAKSQVKYERLDRELTERESQLKQKVEELKQKNEDIDRKRLNVVEDFEASTKTIQEQKAAIQKCNKTIEELKSRTSSMSGDLETANRTVVEYEHQIKSLKEQLTDDEEQAAQNKKTLEIEFQTLLTQYNEEKACLNQELENTKAQVSKLNEELDVAQTQFSEEKNCLTQQIEDSKTRVEQLNEELETNTAKFNEAKSDLEKQIEDTKAKHETHLCEVNQEHADKINEVQIEMEKVTQTLEESEKTNSEKIAKLIEEIGLKENEKLELQFSNKEKSVRIESMSQQLDYLKDVEKSLNSALENLETDNDTMKNMIKQREEVKEELEKMICERDNEIAELKNLIEQLTERKETDVTDYESKLDSLGIEKSNMESQFLEYKTQSEIEMEEVKQKLEKVTHDKDIETEQLQSQISQLNDKLKCQEGDNESKLTALGEEKTELESQFATYRSQSEEEVAELKDKLVEVESYWRSQCEQLEEEYASGTQELREAHQKQVEEIERMAEDKDLDMSSQKETYQQKIQSLEKALHDRTVEVESLNAELAKETEERKSTQVKVDGLNEQLQQINEEMQNQKEAHERQVEEIGKDSTEKEGILTNQKLELEHKIVDLEKILNEKLSEIESVTSSLLKESNERETLKVEKDAMNEQFEKFRKEKSIEIETLNASHAKQVEDLKNGMKHEHKDILGKATSEYEAKVLKLQSEVEEQRVNYQQMVCDMEEKLGGENTMLKERLSQMKCQYEAVIEAKEKDMKKTGEDWQTQIKTVRNEKEMVEQQCNIEREQNKKCQSDIMVLSCKVSEYEKMLSESSSIQTELNQKLEAGSEHVKTLETELAAVKETLNANEEELSGFREGLNHEKGEKEELCRQLEYTQERNDTLTGELSSQQQQLAAVEEEKRQLEIQIKQLVTAHEATVTQFQQEMDTKTRMLDLEKAELERQLQSSQKCYDAMQKSGTEQQQQVEKLRLEIDRLQEKNRELEQRLRAFLEEERHLKEENQMQRDRCTELNNNLQTQIRQFNSIQESNTKQKQEFEQNLRTLREEKTGLEIENAALAKVEQTLKATEAERKKLEEHTDLYKVHYNKKKDIIAKQAEQIEQQNKELDYYKRAEEKLISEYTPLNDKLNMEIMKNKTLGKQLRGLETQLDLANRKLKEYKQQLEKSGSVFLGDSSDFNKMMAARDNCEDASFMENHPSSVPLNSSVFDKENDDTLTPGTRASRSRRRISKTVSSSTVSSIDNADTISIGSASSLAYRLRSRESAVSLNRSITSFDSCKSNVPLGTGRIFHCEDEPMEFEWGRLGELSRRNTMCPSHLKTSYPVETQRYKPSKFRDDALRESTINNDTVISIKGQQPGSGRKRKQGWDSADSGSDSADSKTSKQAKTGCVYQKPGPPTPANSRRSSKGSKSPNTRRNSGKGSNSRSPHTPLSLRGRRTPKRTPKANTPKRSTALETRSNNGSGKKTAKRESVSFNVGFSPLSLGRSNRLTRQQAFIQKQPPSASQVSNLISMFEKRSTPSTFSSQNSSRNATPCLNLRNVFNARDNEQTRSGYRSGMKSISVDYTSEDRNDFGTSLMEISDGQTLSNSTSVNGLCHLSELNGTSVPKVMSDTDITQLVSRTKLPPRDRTSTGAKRSLVYNSTPSLNRERQARKFTPTCTVTMSQQTNLNRCDESNCGVEVSRIETKPPPSLRAQRAEHIYDEIGNIYAEIRPPPIRPRGPTMVSTPLLNRNMSVVSDNIPQTGLDISNNQSMYSVRSEGHIRHLHNSPDFLRQSTRPKFKGNTPKPGKIHSSLNQLNMKKSMSVSEYKGTPKRLRLANMTPVRVHSLLHNEPSHAFQNFDESNFENKPQAGNTPKRFFNRIITKIKTPKFKKSRKNLHTQDEEDDDMF